MARSKPVAEFIDRCLGATMAAKGFAASEVITAWPEIVGERLAAHTEPLRIEWTRSGRTDHGNRSGRGQHAGRGRGISGDTSERPEPATLVVRVTGAFALELQHVAPVVIERVNAYFGWRSVGRLALRQGPLPRRAARRVPTGAPDPQAAAKVRTAVARVEDEKLRDALTRLGDAVAADQGRTATPNRPSEGEATR